MADKMIHVTHEAHRAVRRHCARLGIHAKAWASQVLLEATGVEKVKPAETPQKPAPAPKEPWAEPPFWEGR